jgi:hypothetical protein
LTKFKKSDNIVLIMQPSSAERPSYQPSEHMSPEEVRAMMQAQEGQMASLEEKKKSAFAELAAGDARAAEKAELDRKARVAEAIRGADASRAQTLSEAAQDDAMISELKKKLKEYDEQQRRSRDAA